MPKTLLISAMLDGHFPLLRHAFRSKRLDPVVVLDSREGAAELGLRYAHNDMCYPFILSLGQFIAALESGAYDPANTAVLMPTAGDACRGSNFPSLLRKGLTRAGWPEVEVLTLNVKGLERAAALNITPVMIWKALFAVIYGDGLLYLVHQTRPYEKVPGQTEACRDWWVKRLSYDLEQGRDLTLNKMKWNLRTMAADFASIPRTRKKKQKIALVGEVYTKYCAMGNWDVIDFLEQEGCEAAVNGFAWYMSYYFDNQLAGGGPLSPLWKGAGALLALGQRLLCEALKENGFTALPPFPAFKKTAAPYINFDLRVADGWLTGAEIVNHLHAGCRKVLAIQPFGCLPGHVCGRGQYAALMRRLGKGRLVTADTDASGARALFYDRVKLLTDIDD